MHTENMFCEQCGEKLNTNDRFCLRCGSPTAELQESIPSAQPIKRNSKFYLPKYAKVILGIAIVLIVVYIAINDGSNAGRKSIEEYSENALNELGPSMESVDSALV